MSLLRQLLLSVTIAILVILIGTIFFSISSARQYLDAQLQAQSDSTAASLALTLSQESNQDPVTRELLLSVLFDSGEFKLIEFLDPTGRIIIRRDLDESRNDNLIAPLWFSNFLPLAKHEAQLEVTNGWQQIGSIKLQANDSYARNVLWVSTLRVIALTLISGLLWGFFVLFLMRWLRKALHEDIQARVQAISTSEKMELQPIRQSRVVELRELSQIITEAHEKVQATASERAALIESLELEVNKDPITGLANRKYFINELRALLEVGDNQKSKTGHVMLFRQCDLLSLNKNMNRLVVDQWLKNTGQLVTSLLQDRIGKQAWLARLNGSDFAFVLPSVSGPEAMRISQAVGDILLLQKIRIGKATACRWRLALTDYVFKEDISKVMSRLDEALMRAESSGYEGIEFLPSDTSLDKMLGGTGQRIWQDLLQNALDNNWFSLDINIEPSVIVPAGRANATIMLHEPGLSEPLNGFVFMPAAVRLGLSADCDLKAASLSLDWLKQNDGDLVMRVSLASILQPGFNENLISLLAEFPDESSRLVIELDSFALVAHHKSIVDLSKALKANNARVGLRRFAEQPESILYLIDMQVEYIKISQNLLKLQSTNPGAKRLLNAVRETADECGIVIEC